MSSNFSEILKKIDDSELPFTQWILDEELDYSFILYWLNRWDEIPTEALISISKRKDAHLFFSELKSPEQLLQLFRYTLIFQEQYHLFFNILYSNVREKKWDFHLNSWIDEQYLLMKEQNDHTWAFSKYYFMNDDYLYMKKILELSMYLKRYNSFFKILNTFLNNYLFHKQKFINVDYVYMYRYLEHLKEMIMIHKRSIFTHEKSIKYLLKEQDILYTILYAFYEFDIYPDRIIQIMKIFFNEQKDKMTYYNKLLIVTYFLEYFESQEKNDYIQNDFYNLDLLEIQNLYINQTYKCTRDKKIFLDYLIKIETFTDKNCFQNEKFIYFFLRNSSQYLDGFLDDFLLCKELSIKEDKQEQEEMILKELTKNVSETFQHLQYLDKIIELQKDRSRLIFFKSEIQWYIIQTFLEHLKKLVNNTEKIRHYCSMLSNKLIVFTKFFKLFEKNESFLENLSEEQYTFYKNFIEKVQTRDDDIYHLFNCSYETITFDDIPKFTLSKEIQKEDSHLDAITMEPLETNFYELPTSKVTVNKNTIKLYLFEKEEDPFTKTPITIQEIKAYNKIPEVIDRKQEILK